MVTLIAYSDGVVVVVVVNSRSVDVESSVESEGIGSCVARPRIFKLYSCRCSRVIRRCCDGLGSFGLTWDSLEDEDRVHDENLGWVENGLVIDGVHFDLT